MCRCQEILEAHRRRSRGPWLGVPKRLDSGVLSSMHK